MSTHRSHASAISARTAAARLSAGTGRLLSFGVAAGPVGVVLVTGQMLAVEEFDPLRPTISYLALGPSGGVQTAMFLLTGALYALGAVGLRQSLAGTRGGRWAPVFVALLGLSFIWGGIFPMDPADGFPSGTPDGPAATMSWHGALHQVAPMLASVALIGTGVVLARRYFGLRRRAVGIACLALLLLDLSPLAVAGQESFYAVTTTTQLIAWVLLSALLGVTRTTTDRSAGGVSP